MPFCSKCGSNVADGMSFCPACGTPVKVAAAAAPAPPTQTPTTITQPAATSTGGSGAPAPVMTSAPMASNVAGLLAYVAGFITGIVFLVIEPYKNDKFVRFHAFQSIFFSVACFIVSIAFNIVLGILTHIMGLFGLFWFLLPLIDLGLFLLWLFLMFKAYNNERFMLPIIGELAAKQAGQ